jgi:DNA mismatch repair protein MutS2
MVRAVEWEKFLELAQKEALTEPGRTRVRELLDPSHWAKDLSAAQTQQNETQEIVSILDRDALWGPLVELTSPEAILERLYRGAVLEISELSTLRKWLYAVDSWIQVPRDELKGERFKRALGSLPDPAPCLRVLDHILTPEGELSEKATPKLTALFSEIRNLKKEISQTLDFLLKTFSQKGVLQENFSDVRDGRYVIPVKITSQNEVDGIIYEASASRQTVFIEPKEVSPLNNRLRQRQNDLLQEIYTVLLSASQKIQPFSREIQESVSVLSYWDTTQARARIGRHYSGKIIHVTQERRFQLNQTAHPLLWWSLPTTDIIRNQLDFGQPTQTLLITGPNTGGKTVLLKTLGLAGICARTGFPFPGTDAPTVPFFDSFFADLGDSQSIEQHISSFSGHVLKFKEILENTNGRSLVLMDELNSATDPQEGAALGRALLETIMEKGAMIVTTTHDPHLKALAIADPRITNASMAFDEISRAPTYQMILGVPGRSRALETAERLGIPSEVIHLARSYLSDEHNRFEKMLAQLEADIQGATQARKQATALQVEAERLKKEWTTKTETSVTDMMDRTRQKLRRILEQAQDEVRLSVRALDELKNRKSIDQSRAHLNELLKTSSIKIDSALMEEAPEVAQALERNHKPSLTSDNPPPSFEQGSRVRIPKWKSTGTVMTVTGNQVKIAMGNMQISLSAHEIEPLLDSQPNHKKVKVSVSQAAGGMGGLSLDPKIDLRGTRLDEAMSQLEQYLDLVFRSGHFQEVTIVHGLGTGALREGAHKLLTRLPYVRTFRDGGPGHGGAGATIVEFDRG